MAILYNPCLAIVVSEMMMTLISDFPKLPDFLPNLMAASKLKSGSKLSDGQICSPAKFLD